MAAENGVFAIENRNGSTDSQYFKLMSIFTGFYDIRQVNEMFSSVTPQRNVLFHKLLKKNQPMTADEHKFVLYHFAIALALFQQSVSNANQPELAKKLADDCVAFHEHLSKEDIPSHDFIFIITKKFFELTSPVLDALLDKLQKNTEDMKEVLEELKKLKEHGTNKYPIDLEKKLSAIVSKKREMETVVIGHLNIIDHLFFKIIGKRISNFQKLKTGNDMLTATQMRLMIGNFFTIDILDAELEGQGIGKDVVSYKRMESMFNQLITTCCAKNINSVELIEMIKTSNGFLLDCSMNLSVYKETKKNNISGLLSKCAKTYFKWKALRGDLFGQFFSRLMTMYFPETNIKTNEIVFDYAEIEEIIKNTNDARKNDCLFLTSQYNDFLQQLSLTAKTNYVTMTAERTKSTDTSVYLMIMENIIRGMMALCNATNDTAHDILISIFLMDSVNLTEEDLENQKFWILVAKFRSNWSALYSNAIDQIKETKLPEDYEFLGHKIVDNHEGLKCETVPGLWDETKNSNVGASDPIFAKENLSFLEFQWTCVEKEFQKQLE